MTRRSAITDTCGGRPGRAIPRFGRSPSGPYRSRRCREQSNGIREMPYRRQLALRFPLRSASANTRKRNRSMLSSRVIGLLLPRLRYRETLRGRRGQRALSVSRRPDTQNGQHQNEAVQPRSRAGGRAPLRASPDRLQHAEAELDLDVLAEPDDVFLHQEVTPFPFSTEFGADLLGRSRLDTSAFGVTNGCLCGSAIADLSRRVEREGSGKPPSGGEPWDRPRKLPEASRGHLALRGPSKPSGRGERGHLAAFRGVAAVGSAGGAWARGFRAPARGAGGSSRSLRGRP